MPNLSELSEEEWVTYLKSHYPPSVVRDFMGIQQTAAAARQPNPPRLAKRKTKRTRRVTRVPKGTRVHRYITHAVVLAVAVAMAAHNPVPLIVVGGIGLVAVALIMFGKDAVSSAIAFTIRGRSKTGSYEVNVRVKASSWDHSTVSRALNLVSIFLPPEYRADYVEEQIGNLMATESRRERIDYVQDQIFELPRIAWEFWSERMRATR